MECKLCFAHFLPVNGERVYCWSEEWVGCKWRFGVIRAAALALVASENPSVQWGGAVALLFNRCARNTLSRIYMVVVNGAVWARIYATVALSAANADIWCVIAVALLCKHGHAKKHKCTELWRNEQRLTTYPTKTCLYGIALLKYGC